MKIMNRKKHILPSVLVIVICMSCFVGAAWAWYTAQSAAKVADIEAANYGVKVEIFDSKNQLVVDSEDSGVSHALDLTSNSTYKVKLTGSGVASTGYCVITFTDHVTKEVQKCYTPAIAPGVSYEFTYRNGVFETVEGMPTIQWENKVKATKDVLAVEAFWGTTEETAMGADVVLGREALAKPSQTIIETKWTDKYAVRSDKYTTAPNQIAAGKNFSYTDVITIPKKGTRITFTDDKKTSGSASDQVYVVSSWKQVQDEWVIDLQGTNIVGASGNGTSLIETVSSDGKEITYSYVTSKDNEHIRLCYNSKDKTANPVIYSLYTGETSTAEEIALAEDTSTWVVKQQTGETYLTYKALFEGKTISIIGDSYFYGKGLSDAGDNLSQASSQVWPALLATKYGMTLNNYGLSGSTISNYAGENFNPMVDRWEASFADDVPDIIIVQGGRNDYVKNVPMGELGTLDKATMIGATEYLISSLQEKFPNALIIGTTCWEVGGNRNSAGYYCSDYGRAFKAVCEHLGVSFIDSMDSGAMGVYMTNENFRKRFCIAAGDISHLNEKGMKLVLPVFEKQIYDIYNTYLNPEQP